MAAARWAALRPALEGFVHDARNPLHALMLQLECLRVGPGVTGRRAADMRAQLDRLRGLLESLGDVALPPEAAAGRGPGLEVRAARAMGLLGWALNRRRIRCVRMLEPQLHVACRDREALEFLVGQALWHGPSAVRDGGQLELTVELRGGDACLEVAAEPCREAVGPVLPAFEAAARRLGGDAGRDAGRTWLRLPAGRGA